MANGNRVTIKDCQETITRLKEQVDDLRDERDRLIAENRRLREREAVTE